jgi:hypothetical protein
LTIWSIKSYFITSKLPLNFGIVTGDFYCGFNELTTLIGSPKEVNGYFYLIYTFMLLFEKFKDIETICDDYGIKNYTITNDGLVNVDGYVNISHMRLTKLPFNFGFVTGYFICNSNQLTSLEGGPKEVGGDFFCHNNRLTSLKGCPKEVGGVFFCGFNELTSLIGGPKEVGGDFFCGFNELTSLIGGPKEVGGDFFCGYNELTSLIGCPKEVGEHFYCTNNQLTTLEGCPKEVGGNFHFENNPLPKLILDNYQYINQIIKIQDDYSIWRKDGSLDEYRFKELMKEIKEGL